MTTTVPTGAVRPQIDTEPSAFARTYPERKPFSVQPDRSAENPFEAANGTLRFSSERRAVERETTAQAATRSGTAAPRSASASRASSTRSASGTKRASSSGGSNQPPKKRKRRISKKKKRRLLLAGAFLLFAVLVLVGTILLLNYFACGGRERCHGETPAVSDTPKPGETPAAATLDETVIGSDVTIDGVQVQNLTVAEARRKLNDSIARTRNSVAIMVTYEEHYITLHADDIGLDFSESLEDALLLAAQSDAPQTLKLAPTFSSEALRTALQPLNEQIPSHAVNATAEVKFKTNKIDDVKYYQPYWEFTPGTNGARIDSDALERQITDALNAGDYTADLTPTVAVSEPEVTIEMLQSQYHLLGSYTTNYRFKGSSSTDPDVAENCMARDTNISKAVNMMQVVTLAPGKSFSFNKKTGDRTEKNGWVPANAVYQGSGYRKEPGGGVCQISTTMFNAVLRAGITNINRRGHSIPSDYVTEHFEDGLGFDATVDYKDNHIDFGFKNDTGNTIYMFVYITKNKESGRRKNINVEIYGVEQPGVEYRCRNEILEHTPADDQSKYEYEVDKSMLSSAKPVLIRNPHDGYKVKTYVDKYVNGSFVKTIRTEETVYKVIYPKYKIGSAEVTAAPVNTPKPTTPPDDDEE